MSEPITGITTPIRMEYRYTPGTATSQFLRAMKEGRFEGRRCPSCQKVYFPPRGGCSMCGVEFAETSGFFRSQGVIDLAGEGGNEESATHADAAVDFPDGEIDTGDVEGLAPGKDMLVHGIDQRAIEIEEEGGTTGSGDGLVHVISSGYQTWDCSGACGCAGRYT